MAPGNKLIRMRHKRKAAERQAVKKLKLNPQRIAYMKISLVGTRINKLIK